MKRVSGIGCQVSGVRYRVSGVGCQVSGIRYRVSGGGYQVPVRLTAIADTQFTDTRHPTPGTALTVV